MTLRVLVVDDHESWRLYVSSALRTSPQYQVIGEVADGLEAVQAAARLKPDLIVLDIGLPTLSGIDVARRVLSLAPDSKILFLSEHRSRDIAETALGTGAHGYVVKSHADEELLPAIEAIIQGQPFISASLARQVSGSPSERVPNRTRCHEVEFCSDETSLLDSFVRVAEGGLKSGNAAVVVATRARLTAVRQRLEACGFDIDLATREGRYVSVDVADMLSKFMVNGSLDEARFWQIAIPLVVEATRTSKGGHPRVAACGECAPALLSAGHAAAAVRLEHLWDQLARTYDVDIWCGYAFEEPLHDDETFRRICAEHSAVHTRDCRPSGHRAF